MKLELSEVLRYCVGEGYAVVPGSSAKLLDELMADETVVRGMIARGSPAMLKVLDERERKGQFGVLAGQFKKRLGRDLTTLERGVLVARLQRLGADRLSDVVLDTQGEALSLWLADPDAR